VLACDPLIFFLNRENWMKFWHKVRLPQVHKRPFVDFRGIDFLGSKKIAQKKSELFFWAFFFSGSVFGTLAWSCRVEVSGRAQLQHFLYRMVYRTWLYDKLVIKKCCPEQIEILEKFWVFSV